MEKDFKRSKRRFNTYLYVKKQVNIYKLYNDSIPSVIGKQKKQAALNCGHPKCTMCGNCLKMELTSIIKGLIKLLFLI
jgi:hypothetical protein